MVCTLLARIWADNNTLSSRRLMLFWAKGNNDDDDDDNDDDDNDDDENDDNDMASKPFWAGNEKEELVLKPKLPTQLEVT